MNQSRDDGLTHLDARGNVRMVDVSEKSVTARTATATAIVTLRPDVLEKLVSGGLRKGEAITTAKIAGISAAKRTGDLIPLCHPLTLEWVDVAIEPDDASKLRVTATARTQGRTGVEMEALTAASVAALTLYDMAKAADKSIVIGPVQLEQKSGGQSGTYQRAE